MQHLFDTFFLKMALWNISFIVVILLSGPLWTFSSWVRVTASSFWRALVDLFIS
jgi:hypothetical protein